MTTTPITQKRSDVLERVLADVRRLLPMPSSVTRVLRALDDDHGSARKVSDTIGLDQALTAQVLQMANSVLLGYGPTCSSVQEAVMRIGFGRLRTLVLGAGVAGPLTRRLTGYGLGDGDLWRHALTSATATRILAGRLQYDDPEEAYVGGLLHDMGKLVLDRYMRVDRNQVLEMMRERGMLMWQVEEMLFGADHGTVGGLIASRWQFPTMLVSAIQFHHAPSLAHSNQTLAALVNMGNAYAHAIEMENPETANLMWHPESLRILGLMEGSLVGIYDQVQRVMELTIKSFETIV
jgi:putative nucleotidyltransferase with HDIG domain